LVNFISYNLFLNRKNFLFFLLLLLSLLFVSCKDTSYEPQNYSRAKELFEKSVLTNDIGEKKTIREEIADISPNSEYGLFSQGFLLLLIEDYPEARRFFLKAIEKNSNIPEFYFSKGLANIGDKEYELAVRDFTKVINMRNDYWEAYVNRAIAYRKAKKYEEAMADFNTAIEHLKNDAETWINIGILYYDMKLYEDALKTFELTLKLNPNYWEAYNNRGMSKIKLGMKEEGCADILIAKEHNIISAEENYFKYCK